MSDYEAAAEEWRQAVEDRPREYARARRIEDAADARLEAAEAGLREYETSPGSPLPQYRTEIAA